MGKGKGGGVNPEYLLQMLYPPTGDQTPGMLQSLPGSSKLSLLIDEIGFSRKWTQEQIDSDKKVLAEQRLNTVDDARVLSKQSWKVIPLPPLVKDLIRAAIENDGESKKEKKEKKAWAPPTSQGAVSAPRPNPVSYAQSPEPTLPPAPKTMEEDSMSSGSESEEGMDEAPATTAAAPASMPTDLLERYQATPRSNGRTVKASDPVPSHRMRVRADGAVYEVDRLCPHKQVPLDGVPAIGGVITCPKHKWRFDLKNGGSCSQGKSLNACLVSEW